EVPTGLVEELTRERGVLLVDEIDLADVSRVRRAAPIGRRDHARDHSLKAGRGVGEPHAIALPAFGPGVCSKTCSTFISIANAGQCAIERVIFRGSPISAKTSPNWRSRVSTNSCSSSPARRTPVVVPLI